MRARCVTVSGPGGGAVRVLDASSPWLRLRGLMGRTAGEAGCLLRPCAAIHMLGVRRALDVVWLDRQGTILRVDEGVPPGWRVRTCRGAHAALELPAGTVARLGWRAGDRLAVTAGG